MGIRMFPGQPGIFCLRGPPTLLLESLYSPTLYRRDSAQGDILTKINNDKRKEMNVKHRFFIMTVLWGCIGLLSLNGCVNTGAVRKHTVAAKAFIDSNRTTVERATELYDDGNKQEAYALYAQAAGEGSAEAQYHLARMLLFGDGVPMNQTEGLFWLEKSAAQDNPDALRSLGVHLFNGDFGRTREMGRGMSLLERAASQGDGYSMVFLGYLYQNGYGVPQNPELAASWYRKASKAGFPVPEPLTDAAVLAGTPPARYDEAEDRRAQVKRAQACLKALGYYTGRVNGILDKGTEAAVKRFQKDRKIAVNGKVDVVLMRHIHDRIFNDPLQRNL